MNETPQSRLAIVIETLRTNEHGKINSLRPDNEGFYTVPGGILSENYTTNAGAVYERNSFLKCLSDPRSSFGIRIRNGNCFGEVRHPTPDDCEKVGYLDRLRTIDQMRISHFIFRITRRPMKDGRSELIDMAIKPFGPYKQYLQESLEDPDVNTAFSLRSIVRDQRSKGQWIRHMQSIITFDFEHAGGYDAASKRFSPGNYGMERFYQIEEADITTDYNYAAAGNESYSLVVTNDEILEMLNANKVTIEREEFYLDETTVLDRRGRTVSMAHQMYSKKRSQ